MSDIEQPRRVGRPSQKVSENEPNMRTQILDTAIRCFAHSGYDGVSLRRITSEVGADLGLVRYYFGSKMDLWRAAMEELKVGFSSYFEDLKEEPNNTLALEKLIDAFVKASAEFPQISRIIVIESEGGGERADYITKNLVRPFYARISPVISGAIREGSIPAMPERAVFFMLTHGGAFPMSLSNLTNSFPGPDISTDTGIEAHAQNITSLILGRKR